MEITYEMIGDYLIPNITLPVKKVKVLGKYGIARLDYLKKNNKKLYTKLLMQDKLETHLEEIQEIAEERLQVIIQALATKEKTNEELKLKDQMKWVGLMNEYKMAAEETIMKELIQV